MNQIALLLFDGSKSLNWDQGPLYNVPNEPRLFAKIMSECLATIHPQAWLFWDGNLGIPDVQTIQSILDQPDDLWHAGLQLGTKGKPDLLDFVAPNWMLNRDSEQAAASWRISLRACLVRDDVLRQIEFIKPEYKTLDGAALEWGHRCIQHGVFCRYEPELISSEIESDLTIEIPACDELRFIEQRFGNLWRIWALFRAVVSGYWNIVQSWKAVQFIHSSPSLPGKSINYLRSRKSAKGKIQGNVSVLLPTLDRYSYLKTVLNQLRGQSVPAMEIIVIDQTPFQQRQPELYDDFKDLPLRVIFQDHAGQCSSRNKGLQISRGEYILFIDDDDEIPPDLIEKHLGYLDQCRSDASCGVAVETDSQLPEAFTIQRTSDVFPTNNSMLRRKYLELSGLFDLAYEHGARADADLGMRLYLSGARLTLNPDITVLHHHAPRGGLRVHKARVITYASSRQKLFHRSLPSFTEIFLSKRYFSPQQTRELYWISVFASFSLHHPSRWMRLLKIIVYFILIPDTLLQLRRNKQEAERLALLNPAIPSLESVIKE